MVSLKSFLVAYGFTLLPALLTSASPIVPRYFEKNPNTRINISSTTVAAELGPQLSSGSLVFGSENAQFDDATWRWNNYSKPNVQAVVQPASESDIAKIVKYCVKNGFEFFVRNRGHGQTISVAKFSGIEINVENLRGIEIAADKKTVRLQAGVFGAEVIEKLWNEGYVTTTGSASCVGLIGPGLGGGHSRYEGLYGMVMDTIDHYNVVLADGREIGVNKTSHPDLLWALKGAGHNFAVVTSVVKRIYPGENWYFHTYTWTQDKLETVFETLNTFHKSYNGTTPPKMGVNFGAMIIRPNISATEAVLEWGFHYAGPAEEAEKLLAPFNAIGAIVEDKGEVPYPEISGATDYSCPAANHIVSSSLSLAYNVTTEREHYNHYVKKMAEFPDLAPEAYLYYEGYATAGYQAIPSESTAYPHREENHIVVFFSTVPEGKEHLKEAATTWAKEVWDIWNAGQPTRLPRTYVNYAYGWDWETTEAIYGYEPWRLERLRKLKAKYDPHNRFRYYSPIISGPK